MQGIFSDIVIDFTDEQSMWRSFVKNTFVDDGDIQLVTNKFGRSTYCSVSGGNFVSSLVF